MTQTKNIGAHVILDNVSFAYNTQLALKDITLRFETPGVYALVGSNGSGKTTLLHMLYGLLAPSAGSLALQNATGKTCAASDISFVPDDDNLIQDLTGREYLHFVADCYHMDKTSVDERITALLQLFSLIETDGRLVRGYSHGMRKKLQLAAGVLAPTDILIIDEPTNGLDPLATALASDVIRAAGKQKLVIMATHDLSLAQTIANHVVLVHQSIVTQGSPKDIMKQTKTASLQNAYVKLSGARSDTKALRELFGI